MGLAFRPWGWKVKQPRTDRFEVDACGKIIIENVTGTSTGKREVVEENGFHVHVEFKKERSSKKRPSKKASCQRKKTFKGEVDGPKPTPPMPQEFKNKILELYGENRVVTETLVMQKRVEVTDIDKGKNRLSIPPSKMVCEFLDDDEKQQLPKTCKIIEPNLTQGEVKLSDWTIFYALNGGWNEVKIRNNIVPKLIVQLWAVRVDRELVFVLVDVTTPEEKSRFIEEAADSGILPYKK